MKNGFKSFFLVSLSLVLLSGCATVDNNHDPLENFNRSIYKFNDTFDTYLFRPVAKGYDYVAPDPVKRGISNFFFNFTAVNTIVNDLLQAKFKEAANDTGRFLVNSTVGVLGFFDVARHMGFEKRTEDFGQTLAVWGIENPAYLVIPFLGPSTLRDGPAKFVDHFLSPYPYIEGDTARYALFAADKIQFRASLLDIDETVGQQLDPYTYVRDIYLEDRTKAINDEED